MLDAQEDPTGRATLAGGLHSLWWPTGRVPVRPQRLPTRPTKRTDSRAAGFEGESVEVDALPAGALRAIVEDAILSHIDAEALRLTQVAEQSERDVLRRIKGLAS